MTTITTSSPQQAQAFLDRYHAVEEFLNANCVERKDDIELLLLSMIAGVDLLLLGDPGVGKTYMIELVTDHCIVGADLFTHLCAKDQSVGEILGERDVNALKQGITARVMLGMLPQANFAYLDEIFKSSPPMLNPMLDIFAKRQLKVGGKVIDCGQLVTIFMSSNELPDREDLMAFRDRIAITKFVEAVKSPEGRRRVSELQLGQAVNGIDTNGLDPFTLDEITAMREQAKMIAVPDGIIDIMGEIEQQCLEARHPISQRRKRDIWRMVKAKAWARGGDTVRADDFMVAQHMLWNLASDAASSHDIVLKHANTFVRKAAAIEAELEPIMAEMDKLKEQIETATTRDQKLDLQQSGYHFIRDLQDVVDKAKGYIKQGQHEGQDINDLRDALQKVQKAQKWTTAQLTGVDDDDEEDDD